MAFGLAVLAVALGVRWWLLAGSGWLLDGDDALSALMAFRILDGDRPLVLKEQAYAGAWEPYAMALCYALFGAGRVAAKLPGLAASLALVGATWLLTRAVAGAPAARFAAVLMALPPAYILVLSLKPLAPYTEVAVCGTLALWCASGILAGRDRAREGWRAMGCGAASGLAFWLHPLAVYYLATIAALVLVSVRGWRLMRVGVAGLAGFVVGALPLWMYNVQTHGATARLLLGGAHGEAANPGAVLAAWWHADLPRGAGLWNPWVEGAPGFSPALAALFVGALVWAVVRRPWGSPARRPLDGSVWLLAMIPVIFTTSGFGESALNPWEIDATGRYTLPIWGALAVVLGAFLARVWRGQPVVALWLAGAVLAANVYGYLVIDPVRAFQSPYWQKLPADSTALLATLRREGIAHVWINHWAGLPLMVDAWAAGQPLVAYDWHDVQVGGIDRFPEFRPLMAQAERAAFVLVTDEAEPELLGQLDALGVRYRVHRLPAYVMVVPLSRPVHAAEVVTALDERY